MGASFGKRRKLNGLRADVPGGSDRVNLVQTARAHDSTDCGTRRPSTGRDTIKDTTMTPRVASMMFQQAAPCISSAWILANSLLHIQIPRDLHVTSSGEYHIVEYRIQLATQVLLLVRK